MSSNRTVTNLLGEELLLLDFEAKDKWEAIQKLIDHLIGLGRLRKECRQIVTDALVARERIASTGIEHGVAIPHATVDVIDDAVAAFGLSPKGIPFQSVDGRPSRLIFLLLIPRKSVQKHIHTIAGIAHLLNYEEVREALLRAHTTREVCTIIREEEEKEAP